MAARYTALEAQVNNVEMSGYLLEKFTRKNYPNTTMVKARMMYLQSSRKNPEGEISLAIFCDYMNKELIELALSLEVGMPIVIVGSLSQQKGWRGEKHVNIIVRSIEIF